MFSTHLDPIEDSPMATGPSVNMPALTAQEPRWREESFNIRPQRMPISFKMKPSVIAHQPRQPDLAIARVPVMVRSSNQRPVEAGNGPQGSMWQISDPMASHLHQPSGALPGMGEDPLAPKLGLSTGAVLGIGALAGCLCFFLCHRRR
jgi:hypothetical protein